MPFGPATVLRTLFDTVRRLLVGRQVTVREGQTAITLRLTEVDADLDPLRLSVGQLGDVRLVGEDVRWGDHTLDRVVVTLGNVHLRPGDVPVLVAAPVDLEVTVAAGVVTGLVRDRVPWLLAAVDEDAVPTLRLRRWPALAHVEVEVRPDGSHLWIRPRAIVVRGRRWEPGRRVPAVPVRLSPLPADAQLTGIRPGPGVVHLTATVPAWRKRVPLGRLENLIAQIRSATTLFDLSAG